MGNRLKTVIINMESREDRLKYTKELIGNRLDYSIFKAIDGTKLEEYSEYSEYSEYPEFNKLLSTVINNPVSLGEIGCKLSHYLIWKNILNTTDKITLILEDDNGIGDNKDLIDISLINESWDLIYVGGQWTPNYGFNSNNVLYKSNFIPEKSEFFTKVENTNFYKRTNNTIKETDEFGLCNSPLFRTTSSYIISPTGAKKLVDFIDKQPKLFMEKPLDVWLLICEAGGLLLNYDYLPHLFYQLHPSNNKDAVLTSSNINRSRENKVVINKNFIFIPNEDELGNDMYYHKLSIYECMKIAEKDPNCVGFNTQGFFKNKITNLTKSKYFSTSDGIYIKKNKIIILPFNVV